MKRNRLSRRQFIATASATPLVTGTAAAAPMIWSQEATSKLAVLGGQPVRRRRFPDWPPRDARLIDQVLETTRSGNWCRIQAPSEGTVATLEQRFAELLDARFCVATGSGTQALHTCVEAFGIGPGDEVITSPYTDPGTIASILAAKALPVLADLDPASFQIDPQDVERRITPHTRALMPVHIMGQPCDMDGIMEIARRHDLKVIEDSCQAHQAMYRGRRLGTIGDVGCFSFQSSKTIACGEGGAIVGNDESLMDRCYTIHNHGTSREGRTELAGPKYRMNELEGALLLGQWQGLSERFRRRNENAAYLSRRLEELGGLIPQKLYPGTESGSFYNYATSYQADHFDGAGRRQFLKALEAEGIAMNGYIKRGLHREPWVDNVLSQEVYRQMYGAKRLAGYREGLECPNCDRVCAQMVRFWGSGVLLGDRTDMDDIATAVQKVYENRSALREVEVEG